jgi:copper chaperone NosL
MLKMKTISFVFLINLFLLSCKVEPKPIEYGNDHCDFCDMTVVDKTHASEVTTKKGRSKVYDAIECMVNDLNQNNDENKMAYILVANYDKPGDLIDAKNATFLISKKIKSPMGAFLSAFTSKQIAEKYQNDFGGELYSWSELKSKFQK